MERHSIDNFGHERPTAVAARLYTRVTSSCGREKESPPGSLATKELQSQGEDKKGVGVMYRRMYEGEC
ncbi:hypothetical protein E2C01_082853 [Portunus trituberculatus]|uniref:Uncharacterized protein n=1 Tax=Portunus trituberculatus TaxID=210409 RepID=A0A5B7J2Y5_PORTR|nr:hypothetical protein [Portunus trituberculatus]